MKNKQEKRLGKWALGWRSGWLLMRHILRQKEEALRHFLLPFHLSFHFFPLLIFFLSFFSLSNVKQNGENEQTVRKEGRERRRPCLKVNRPGRMEQVWDKKWNNTFGTLRNNVEHIGFFCAIHSREPVSNFEWGVIDRSEKKSPSSQYMEQSGPLRSNCVSRNWNQTNKEKGTTRTKGEKRPHSA